MKIFLLYFTLQRFNTFQQFAVDLQKGEYNPISYHQKYLHMDCLIQVTMESINQNNHIDTENVLNQLMKNVHITQSKKQQILNNHHHKSIIFSQAHYHLKTSNTNDKENQPCPQLQNTKDLKGACKMITNEDQLLKNEIRQKSQNKDLQNKPHLHPQSILQSKCQQVSQPYLNIREQYVYPSSIIHQKNEKYSQGNPSRNELNNCSIELSQSVQQSQEMLLHHSVSSKFLQSPTFSLGLIESKITKKSTLSHLKNSKNILNIDKNLQNIKNNRNNNGNNQSMNEGNLRNQKRKQRNISQVKGQNNREQGQKMMINKEPSIENLMFLTDSNDISSIKNIQLQNNKKIRDKQLKLKEKINKLIEKQQSTLVQAPTVLQTNSDIPTLIKDQELNSQIVTSYQMEVEYLRKINLIQSMEIQKLRKLLRLSTKENQPENIKHNINGNKDKDSNAQKNNQINTKNDHNHHQSLFVDSQVPFRIQHNNNKCISQTTNSKVTSTNTKITSLNSVNSINQTQDIFQNYIKNNKNHKPSKKTLIKQGNRNTHPTQSLRNSLLNDPMARSILNDLNSKNIKEKMKDNKHRVSLNEMDINSTLTFNKHNLSCNNESSCKKYNQSTCKKLKLNKKTQNLGSSCQRQLMFVRKQTRNKQRQVMSLTKQMKGKQNIESKTLSMKKREHNKGKKKQAICSVDLLESIKKQLYNEEKRK